MRIFYSSSQGVSKVNELAKCDGPFCADYFNMILWKEIRLVLLYLNNFKIPMKLTKNMKIKNFVAQLTRIGDIPFVHKVVA